MGLSYNLFLIKKADNYSINDILKKLDFKHSASIETSFDEVVNMLSSGEKSLGLLNLKTFSF